MDAITFTPDPFPRGPSGHLFAAQFMVVLDVAIVNVARPDAGEPRTVGGGEQWVVNAYTLTSPAS